MATINMKRIVADALASHLASNVAGLAGKVTAVAAGPETTMPCLAVKIIPDTFIFEPAQEDEVYELDPDDGKVILDVGSWVGNFMVELYTPTPAERELYEQRIIDLFMATEWASGTLYIDLPALTVGGYISLYQAQIKFRLEQEQWMDELAFENKRYAFLDVYVDYPALVTRAAKDLDIKLALTDSADSNVVIDMVRVEEDGTVSGTSGFDEGFSNGFEV